eukprot:5033373-Pleurochrysis_carterae.AAC.1
MGCSGLTRRCALTRTDRKADRGPNHHACIVQKVLNLKPNHSLWRKHTKESLSNQQHNAWAMWKRNETAGAKGETEKTAHVDMSGGVVGKHSSQNWCV